ncbi:hypothetical protein [Desulfosporosinus sp. BICA1-9]|uniref:hypothetical protein n=1 Tax=Desulfosporosinus sp. BICA1-9 TaxID=1531958 RepID=UPI00054BF5B4|nr:hypothetical protein [Desulfosporosinus sp. BICA1-9]KJS50211.1 MAG: hypothetical protein VR66_04135 [Peptococcaceae bacterium BRH_c23]KJS85864.1 MAG: hypothetical protein JL57_17815 [Desulfosporosinus sp. BICA1-9]HBW39188.1 hypothetical protein [Desulfosporosinus sp.]
MYLRFRTELLQLSHELEQLWVPELRGASNETKFLATKGRVLDILKVLYGETSREFRVVKLTCSPATVVKVVNHIICRASMNSPYTKAVNM